MNTSKIDKTILAFDAAMTGLSVGVIANNGHIVSRQIETQRAQASLLIPTIQEVLDEAQIGFNDIGLLACGIGPGSFTGLRIALTTAKALRLSLDVPLVGLNTLEIMAQHYPQAHDPLLIVLETKRQEFYAQYFHGFDTGNPNNRGALSSPICADANAIIGSSPDVPFVVGGDCLQRFSQECAAPVVTLDEWVQADPILMAQMAWNKFQRDGVQENIEPLYLRGADVSYPKNKPRKLKQT